MRTRACKVFILGIRQDLEACRAFRLPVLPQIHRASREVIDGPVPARCQLNDAVRMPAQRMG